MEPGATAGDSPPPGASEAASAPPGQPKRPKRPKKQRRLLLKTAIALPVALVAAALAAWWWFNGPRLGEFVANDILNPGIQGRVEIGSIEWPASGLLDLRHVQAKAKNVRVYDPEGRLVMWVPEADAVVDAWELIKPGGWPFDGHHDVVVHSLTVKRAWARVLEEETPADPLSPSTIGFVAAWDAKPELKEAAERARKAGKPRKPGSIIDVHGARLENVDLELDFLDWYADLYGVSSDAWLWMNARDPQRVPEFMYWLERAKIRAGRLTISEQTIDLFDAEVAYYGQGVAAPQDMVWDVRKATTAEGAEVTTRGTFANLDALLLHGAVDMKVAVGRAGGLLARFAPGLLSGDQAAVELELAGPLGDLTLHVKATALDVDPRSRVPDAPTAHVPLAAVTWQLGRSDVRVDALDVLALGGKIRADGEVHLGELRAPDDPDDTPLDDPLRVDLTLTFEPPLDVTPWLPPDALAVTGSGRLSGRLGLRGTAEDMWLDPLDLWLGRAHLAGKVNYTAETGEILPVGLHVDVPEAGASARASGRVNARSKTLTLGFNAQVKKLAPWLRRLKLPAVATSVGANGVVSGSFAAPRVSASAHADGVPYTGRVDARLDFFGGRLTLKELRARPLGGSLVAGGRLRLAEGRRPASIDEAWASLSGLKLGLVPGMEKILGGEANAEVTVLGSLARPLAAVAAEIHDVTLSGEPLGDVTAELRTDEDAIFVDRLELSTGDASALAQGSVSFQGDLDLSLEIARLPLVSIPGLATDPGLGVDGFVSTDLRIGGTTRAPTLDGHVGAGEIAYGPTIFGAGRIDLSSPSAGLVAFAGRLFQGKLTVTGDAQLVKPYGARLTVVFRRVELAELVTIEGDAVRGWVSGQIDVDLGRKLAVTLSITELRAEVDGQDERGRPAPVPIANAGPIVVEWDGTTARLPRPARLRTPEGEFTLAGSASAAKLDVSVSGEVQLALAEVYLRRFVDRVDGVARVDVRLTGTAEKPLLRGTLALSNVSVLPRGSETEVALPVAQVSFANDVIEVHDLAVEIDGNRLSAEGKIRLAGLTPTSLDVRVRGRLSAQILAIAAGAAFSDTAGSAAIDIEAKGPVASPNLSGTLAFDRRFMIAPRGLRRDVAFTSGKIVFRSGALTVESLRGTVDDGPFTAFGLVRLADWELARVDLTVNLDGLTHRIPGVLDIEANARLSLTGGPRGLLLSGDVDLIDGRYVQNFRFTDFLRPIRTTEKTVPFWEGNPLLETMRLNLSVETTGVFQMVNNISQDMVLTGSIQITNTPPDPRLSGRITIENNAQVKIQGLRTVFEVTSGNVSFSPYERAMDGTNVNIEATSIYTDREERVHNIRLGISGKLANLRIDLSTQEGLNFAQTFLLISSGQTADETRQQARGDSETVVPRDASQGTSSGVGDGGVGSTADRLVKDFASDFLANTIEEPFRQFTGLDCVRFEIGTESSLLALCKKLGRGIRADYEYEYGYQGRDRHKFGLTSRLTDRTSLSGIYQNRDLAEDEDNEEPEDFTLELKYRWTIK